MSDPKPSGDCQPTSAEALPGSIRAVIPHPFGGRVIMTGFPGLETGIDGLANFLPESCRETLEGMASRGAERLVVLVERDELDALGFDVLEATARAVGLSLDYQPMVDYSVPSADMARAWAARRPEREAILRAGGTLAYSCQYGAGRSGLMASWALMEAGLSAQEAIGTVRQHFADAVESQAQEEWLAALIV